MGGGTYITEDEGSGRCLVLRQPWSLEFASVIKREGIRELSLQGHGSPPRWPDEHLHFLEEVPECVTRFHVYSGKVVDLSPMVKRKGIEELSFNVNPKHPIDLAAFEQLRHLYCRWSKKTRNLDKCHRLEYLTIDSYPGEDLGMLASMRQLENLKVYSRKLCSLAGISKLTKLRTLELCICTKLTSLEGIEELSNLEELEVYACKKISMFPRLASMKRLKKVRFENCGPLPSLKFLSGSESLEWVSIVDLHVTADKDLSPLQTLPSLNRVTVPLRRDYSPPYLEIQALPEKNRLRQVVQSIGYRCQLDRKDLPGCPALVFPDRQRVIFYYACRVHRHDLPECREDQADEYHYDYWSRRLRDIDQRDAQDQEALAEAGWEVLVIWQCELAKENKVVERIRKFLDKK